jgi:hypothetical protein
LESSLYLKGVGGFKPSRINLDTQNLAAKLCHQINRAHEQWDQLIYVSCKELMHTSVLLGYNMDAAT